MNLNTLSKLLIFGFFCILNLQFSFIGEQEISKRVLGKWQYQSHIYFSVGRYGPKEVDPIKSSWLCFTDSKIYFKNVTFIDTCFYSDLEPKGFFDRKYKKPHYLLDGPLAIKFSEEQLSKFVRLDLKCKSNDFGTFYLNADTLILDSSGGVTFFFTKTKVEPPN